MKEQLPSPDFDKHQYERPNQNWICGHAAEGKPCRIGPDGKGHCRATYECQPALETNPGESKGRYKCTRPVEYGGPCRNGPMPDGTCCRPITKCVPVRSLRAKRKLLAICVTAFTAGILLIGLCGPLRSKFINPGKLSSQHSTAAFAKIAGARESDEETCVACHGTAHAGPHGLMKAAFNATPGPFQVRALAAIEPPGMNAIDQNCEHCHAAHSFHEPNVARAHSCSACHREHQGSGLMPKPTDANCLSCHANAEVMRASVEIGRKLPAEDFDFRAAQGRILFKAPRPKAGYTGLIHSFAADHPEFQVLAEKLRDPDTLKFNHALHLTSANIPPLNGHKLDCADCHKPDAAGVYYLKISYEENCRTCHSLQFDVNNPQLRLPHGSAEHVRAFLRSLPEQYADFGAKQKGIAPAALQNFVQTQMAQIRGRYGSGEELERRIFFSDARTGPVAQAAGTDAMGAARFPGCAYCHQVAESDDGAPAVNRPFIPDRWLIRGRFDHTKHFKVACAQCHDAAHSRDTADILLPNRASCVECHSPKGGVASSCSTCHTFHSAKKEMASAK
ncbi:MAG TPA: hypothetical protein VH597_15960 [Verrucomicrobiae bacterium]|jgi:hypothetical protein|nr:hypothetical protein [Verrucomicrobiae bacterium]